MNAEWIICATCGMLRVDRQKEGHVYHNVSLNSCAEPLIRAYVEPDSSITCQKESAGG